METRNVGACDGVWKSLRLAGISSQAINFVLVCLSSVAVKIFFAVAVRAIREYNAAINCVAFQDKKINSRHL
jgi:hypothetical protein